MYVCMCICVQKNTMYVYFLLGTKYIALEFPKILQFEILEFVFIALNVVSGSTSLIELLMGKTPYHSYLISSKA